MSTPNDLQALLASIRPRPSPSNASNPAHDNVYQRHQQSPYHPGLFPPHPQQQQPYDGQSFPHPQQHNYHHPTVSSALQSPSPVNTPPHHGSDILSPNASTPRGDWPQQQAQQSNNPDRAANLLNLLRFSQGPGGISAQPIQAVGPEQPRSPLSQEMTSHGRNISASDLVGSLFGKQSQAAPVPAEVPLDQQNGPNENTQDMLLRLLNRPQPGAEVEAPGLVEIDQSVRSPRASGELDNQEVDNAILKAVNLIPNGPAKPGMVASPGTKDSMFTYVNPFDQLAAVSPRTRSPQPKTPEETPTVEVTQKQKVPVTVNIEQPAVPEMPEYRIRNESPVLEEGQREAVNDVVGRLVDEIGRSFSESEPVPAPATEPAASVAKEDETEAMLSSIASNLRETATEAKEADLKKSIAPPQEMEAEIAVPPVARPNGNEAAEALADSWESAEDSAEKEEERIVSVQNFPLRPFISITVNPQTEKLVTFRNDGIMDIARLKKEFDQLDRSLTAATSEYIVYALAKSGGIRIIRQDDGSDRQVFRSTRDRVFNVALCSSTGSSGMQAILGIGVSGAVYWALISRSDKDLFDLDALESESLVFPPFPASDENTSGGQLKTRAKQSTRHPELFAIGRGKNIYVVSPRAAMNPNYGVTASQRTVNTEKFFKERSLKISTGKAGKDFAFSEDDTVIASLDKTGRLRFWDIRDFLDIASFVENPPSEVRVPLNTYVTGSPTEKSWPTSVLFLDKHRPYTRAMALRYVLVGLKQNHTLQLWDIGLGKAVEELKFPHENESDAICSVAYHPPSGIVVIGHPTRNSIYFVHLSVPAYNLPPLSQADFIKSVSGKDNSLPKPESTACLSGIREISLGSKGQLRSLELLPITKSATDKRGMEETGLFELYVMHSRGVTCLNIKKEDLGWTSDNKVVRPVDALEQGSIEINDLQSFPSYVTDDPSVNGDATSAPSRAVKEVSKKVETTDSTGVNPSRNPSPTKVTKKEEQAEPVSALPGPDKSEKKKKKKGTTDVTVKTKEPSVTVGVESLPVKDQPKQNDLLSSSLPTMNANANLATDSVTPVAPTLDHPAPTASSDSMAKDLKALHGVISLEFDKKLGTSFESLYARFDDERRSWDEASTAKQDQVLRLVSSTLSDNVEKNLTRIISQSIHDEVIPTIAEATSATVTNKIDSVVSQEIGTVLRDELHNALPEVVTSALHQSNVMSTIADEVIKNLAPRVENEVYKAVQSAVGPVFEEIVRNNRQKEEDLERRFNAQLKHYEAQREVDAAKMEEMANMMHGLSNAMASLTVNQSRPTQQAASKRPSPGHPVEPTLRAPKQPVPVSQAQAVPSNATPFPPTVSPEQAELAEISRLIGSGHLEEGTIKVCLLSSPYEGCC